MGGEPRHVRQLEHHETRTGPGEPFEVPGPLRVLGRVLRVLRGLRLGV